MAVAWLAVATRRGARGHSLTIALLIMLLVAVLILCFKPASKDASSASDWKLERVFARSRLPDSLNRAARNGEQASSLLGEVAAVRNANVPMKALGPAPEPFHFSGALRDRTRARACLAAAMLFEAGDDAKGQFAVGQVVLNRVRHRAFPNSICGVVLQGSDRLTGCQFTFTCDGSLARQTHQNSRARAILRADMMLNGFTFAAVGLATHYHTVYVHPWWSPRLDKIARQGAHLFFRWPGSWGSAAAMVNPRGISEPSAALFVAVDPLLDAIEVAGARGQLPTVLQEDHAPALAPIMGLAAKQGSHVALHDLQSSPVPASRRLIDSAGDRNQTAGVVFGSPPLEGSRLLRMFPEGGVFFLRVAAEASRVELRRVAGMLCGGRTQCHVYGWLDPASTPPTRELDSASASKLAFRFVRKPGANAGAIPDIANAF